jgi:hypothetical protein
MAAPASGTIGPQARDLAIWCQFDIGVSAKLPFGLGPDSLEILSDQKKAPPGEWYLAPPKYRDSTGGTSTLPRLCETMLFNTEQ